MEISRANFSALFGLCLAASLFQTIGAQDWPQWRGPNRDGVVTSFSPPAKWPAKLKQTWKTPVGGGYSSPVVSESRIYVHTREGDEEIVRCLDLIDGRTVWRKSYKTPFTHNQYAKQMGQGPFSTPVLHRENLYTLGSTAILSCFDAKSGELRWRKDYSRSADTSKLFCGAAMSPVVDSGLLIVHVGDDRQGWVIAYNAATGEEQWRWEGDGPGYASPIIAELGGERQIVTLTDKSVIGIAVASGKLLWKLAHPDQWNENIVTPVLYGQTLIISGVRQGTQAVKVTRTGEGWKTTQLWHNQKLSMYMSSPVLDGDLIYGLSFQRKGQFFCLDAATGEVRWTTEGRDGQNASLLQASKEMFLLTSDGDLIVAYKNSQGFEPIARYKVADAATWSHPVILGRRILVKDASALTLWEID
jgi:outer membrane protein assembly factor BamB